MSLSAHSQNVHPDGYLVCEWCGTRFEPRSYSGRVPRFCRASHRVRACERRRGLLRPGQPPTRTRLPAPTQQSHPVGVEKSFLNVVDRLVAPIGHETGNARTISARTVSSWGFHRARVGALPNKGGFVPSLCGAMIRVIGLPTGVLRPHSCCRTCERLAGLHPTSDVWWTAQTQRIATALADDLRSMVLAVGQAVALQRDPITVLARVDGELRTYIARLGLSDPLECSTHPRSTAA